MRIALIFAGQPRAAHLSYPYFERNLLSQYDVDVFGCFWATEAEVNFGEWAFKAIEWIDPAPADAERKRLMDGYAHEHSKLYPAENAIAMYQALAAAQSLPLEAYDVVIRARTDYALNRSFAFETLDLSKMHQPLEPQSTHLIIGNDQFGFGSSAVMRVYFETLKSVPSFIADGHQLSGEGLLNYHLIANGFTRETLELHDMNNPFEPKGFDSFPHSLIRSDFVAWRGVDITKRPQRRHMRRLVKRIKKMLNRA